MRVAVVVNCLKMGGMERVAVNLADAFVADGHEAHLIYLKDRKIELQPRSKEVLLHLFNLKKWVFASGIGLFWFLICKLINIKYRKTFPHYFAYAQAKAFKQLLQKEENKYGQFDLIIFRVREHLIRSGQSRMIALFSFVKMYSISICISLSHRRSFLTYLLTAM